MDSYSLIGPPGCGKSHTLSHQAARAAEKHGGDMVLITSLTRTAAAEIRGRTSGTIPEDNAGTLHSFCYRALGRPEIAEVKIKEWNEAYPRLAVSGGGDLDEVSGERQTVGAGDEMLAEMNLRRQRMQPRETWPQRIGAFAARWFDWLEQTDRLDFTGLIEHALEDIPAAPGTPLVMLNDEAQDYSALEIALTRKWAEPCLTTVWAHDPWQQIFDWRGADVSWLTSLPQEQQRALRQSYRVPRAVHAAAMRWMRSYGPPIEYHPREADGAVDRTVATWKHPEPLIPIIEQALAEGRNVMALATCEYMLRPLLAVLRDHGIPFHNPFRTKNGAWNPLAQRRGVTSVTRLLAFTKPGLGWNADDIRHWIDPLRSKDILVTGAKTQLADAETITYDELADVFSDPEQFARAVEQNVDWWLDATLASRRQPLEYPVAVLKRRGREALEHAPSVIAGTVHSVKGGEASEVIVFPDLSRPAYQQWLEDPRPIRRVFYVALTRARERLWLCQPQSGMAVDLP